MATDCEFDKGATLIAVLFPTVIADYCSGRVEQLVSSVCVSVSEGVIFKFDGLV